MFAYKRKIILAAGALAKVMLLIVTPAGNPPRRLYTTMANAIASMMDTTCHRHVNVPTRANAAGQVWVWVWV